MIDLFICVGEMSGDQLGALLVEALLALRPSLHIGAVTGPKMRKWPVQEFCRMEELQVMGFIDVFWALPKLIRTFFQIRNQILRLSPKAVVLIDYPGFHLRLEKSLRKRGYQGKIIHYVCPSVWAWGKGRIPQMAKNLDLLLTLFPFEKKCFEGTKLDVRWVGHPLVQRVKNFESKNELQGEILALFPGSRKVEIERNLPLQLKVARRLREEIPTLKIAISLTQFPIDAPDAMLIPLEKHYELMRAARVALATFGTVVLELALHKTATVAHYAITPLDLFLAQKIFRFSLPFYSLPNIILNEEVFPELFGNQFTEEKLFESTRRLWIDRAAQKKCLEGCEKMEKALAGREGAIDAAEAILSTIDI